MRTPWIGLALTLVSPLAVAQSTIYKHVDESGRVTYTNRPMAGAMVVNLEPLSTIPGFAGATRPPAAEGGSQLTPVAPVAQKSAPAPAVAKVTPRPASFTLAAVDREPRRDDTALKRQQLQGEITQAEKSLAEARKSLAQEQRNPTLIAAVRAAQQAVEPTPAQQAQMRADIDRASGRIRGLQAIVAEQEKNIEALKNELGALKP